MKQNKQKPKSVDRVKNIIINKLKNDFDRNKIMFKNINNKNKIKNEKISKENKQIISQFEKFLLEKYLKNYDPKNWEDGENFAKVILLSMKIKMAKKSLLTDNKPIKIINNIYLGSIGSALDIQSLNKFNITHIISILDFPINMYSNIKYYNLELKDSKSENIKKYFEEINNYILDLLTENKNNLLQFNKKLNCYNDTLNILKAKQIIVSSDQGYFNEFFKLKENNILIHCFAGVSRSSTIVLSFLMKYWNFDLKKAHEFLKIKRNRIKPNSGFITQLKEYEQELLNKNNI